MFVATAHRGRMSIKLARLHISFTKWTKLLSLIHWHFCGQHISSGLRKALERSQIETIFPPLFFGWRFLGNES